MSLIACLAFLCFTATAANRILDLDGNNSYVELPPNIFNELTEATVEGWVKWDRFKSYSRFFDFGKENQSMTVNHLLDQGDLRFELWQGTTGGLLLLDVPDLLRTNVWCHIAAVSGKGGAKLYFDGVLVYASTTTNSFSAVQNGDHNFLGHSNWKPADGQSYHDLLGQIDEFRVWKVARTQEQIRETMFQRLTGDEPDLFGLWNFDHPEQPGRDATAAGNHAKFFGQARTVERALPSRAEMDLPTVVFGQVTDASGQLQAGAAIRLYNNDDEVRALVTSRRGTYRACLYLTAGNRCDVEATRVDLNAWAVDLALQPGEERQVDLILKPPGSISGSVMALDDSPLNAVVVQAMRAQAGGLSAAPEAVVATVMTDSKGKFSFRNLKPGQYHVRIQTPGQFVYYNSRETILAAREQKIAGINFRVPPFKKGTWRSYSEVDGLPGAMVRAIYEDSDGALWFGTTGGLARFDGHRFRAFTSEEGLIHNYVNKITRDRNGMIWIATGRGVSRFDGKRFLNFGPSDGLPANNYETVYAGHNGDVWLGTSSQGVYRYDGKRFSNFTKANGFPGTDAFKMDGSKDGTIWIASDAGLVRYDGTNFTSVTQEAGLQVGHPDSPHVAKDGSVWFATHATGIWRYDPMARKAGKEAFRNLNRKGGLLDDVTYSIEFAPQDVIWAGGQGGVSRYDGKTVINFTGADGLGSGFVTVIHRTADGVLWFATSQGVTRYDENSLRNYTTADGLITDRVYSSCVATDGTLWFAGIDGVSQFDGRNFKTFAARDGFPAGPVRAIRQAPDGKIWASTGPALVVWDGQKWNSHSGTDQGSFTALDISAKGLIWFGTADGRLGLFDLTSEGYGAWYGRLSGPDPVGSLLCQGENTVWVGFEGSGGLERYDRGRVSKNRSDRYEWNLVAAFKATNGLASNVAISLHRELSGSLWVAGGGLTRLDGDKATTYLGNREAGRGVIYSVFRDSDELLWVGRTAGMRMFDGQSWSGLTTRHGLAQSLVRSITQDKDGFLWFGTDEGGITRYKRATRTPPAPTVLLVSDTEHSNAAAFPDITTGQRITLKGNLVDLRTLPENRQYRWQLVSGQVTSNELAGKWQTSITESQLDWSTNRAGRYTFAVQYIDGDLNYSPPTIAALTLVPPWYLDARIAVPTVAANLALLGVAIISTARSRRRKREAERLREQLFEQEHIAREAAEAAREAADAANQTKSQFLARVILLT